MPLIIFIVICAVAVVFYRSAVRPILEKLGVV
jgi:hypothetical protein